MTRKRTKELLPLFTTKDGFESWICYKCELTSVEETDEGIYFGVGQDHYFLLKIIKTTDNSVLYKQLFMDEINCDISVVIEDLADMRKINVNFCGPMDETRFHGSLIDDYKDDWTLDEIG